ncbi:MAG: hypothetical protein PHE49_00195 [bacterium]|nr:hypothetical protein [bacterium]
MKDNTNSIIKWLLAGDPSIIYQTNRDLLNTDIEKLNHLRKAIAKSGWGKKFLDRRNNENGLWGNGIYSPKWISTTYTLLDLKNIAIPPETKEYIESSKILINTLWKIPQKKKERYGDLCVCGMILNICCYAKISSPKIDEIIDFILGKQFPDGGWNCRWEFDKNHSSLHTTINILEGLKEYLDNNYSYKNKEIIPSIKKAHEFILMHKLYKSDKTDEIIDKKMTMLSYPVRWKYDILRCMDYFRSSCQKYDNRMEEALEIILGKKLINNHWPVQQKYAGRVHFEMEAIGKESRWNTLRVLRVLKKYKN